MRILCVTRRPNSANAACASSFVLQCLSFVPRNVCVDSCALFSSLKNASILSGEQLLSSCEVANSQHVL